MFDVSWGELLVVSGVGIALVGRRDLPKASRFIGTQVGRVVGLLQGARARADRFTAQNELRQLQNELRSGLRELDAVKSELAVAASGQGLMGRGLGATVASANRSSATEVGTRRNSENAASQSSENVLPDAHNNGSGISIENSQLEDNQSQMGSFHQVQIRELAPKQQAVAAVAEEEWQKQGIGFQSRAERGNGADGGINGSMLLSNLIQQSLIHDQYDRVVQEQEEALQSRANTIKEQLRKDANKEK